MLLLDDLHWADTTSLALLLYLGRHLTNARLLILGTYRNVDRHHPLAEIVDELVRERVVDDLALTRLVTAQTADLVRAQLRASEVADELVGLIHARAEGNPFFTEELLRALVERVRSIRKEAPGGCDMLTVGRFHAPFVR